MGLSAGGPRLLRDRSEDAAEHLRAVCAQSALASCQASCEASDLFTGSACCDASAGSSPCFGCVPVIRLRANTASLTTLARTRPNVLGAPGISTPRGLQHPQRMSERRGWHTYLFFLH